MKRARRVHMIDSRRQSAVLVSAARQEIVDVLSRMGTVSVAELAATLGRPADALYYHLRELIRAGLVQRTAAGKAAVGREARYRTVATELHLRYPAESDDTGRTRSVSAIVSSMLRLGIRDFHRALEGGEAQVTGPSRDLWALRAIGWLSPDDVRDVNRKIRSLRTAVWKPKGKGRLYGITVLLTPLDHRGRKIQGLAAKRPVKP